MKVQKDISQQAAHFSEYGIQVSDMCSEVSHFVVFDFSYAQLSRENLARRPTVVTYRHPTITFTEILQRYVRLCPSARIRKNLRFTLPRGYIIPMRSSVLDLKKSLRRESVDGLVLFTFEGFEEDEEEQREGDFVNECGLMDYIGREDAFQKEKLFTFHFHLPATMFVISLQLSPNDPTKLLMERFLKEVGREFGVMLEREDVKGLRVRGKELQLRVGEPLSNQPGLYDQDSIEVVLAGKGHQFIKQGKQDNRITLVKEQPGRPPRSIQLNYQDYKSMQVKNIYRQYFLEKGEVENEHIPVCLRVMEYILKGGEPLLRLSSAIQKLRQLGEVKLVGHFISEKMVFYKQVPLLLEGKDAREFTLEELDIPEDQVEERSRCDELIKDRLGTIDVEYFRNRQHVEPIFIYTTNLQYLDKNGEKKKIYESLNTTLRSSQESILRKNTKEIEESWVYRYTSTLLKHLQNITGERCKVYRGANWDPQGRPGELLTFKPFTSTSKNINEALKFPIYGQLQDSTRPLVLFEMSIVSGKPISKLSYFKNEEELLLEPFTEFRITKVEEKRKEQGFEFKVYHLEEVDSAKEMPKASNNYVLWIDNKPNEGREIFNKFIEEFNNPSVLFQINSTQHLQQWVQERQDIIKDADSKIVMVTNMVRPEENGVPNFYAGVDAINLIRESLPDIPIAVYVRDTNASNKNLDEKQVSRKNLVVINQFEELGQFAERNTTLKFRSLIPIEEPLQHTQPPQHSHPPVQQKGSKSAGVSKGGKEKGLCEIM